MKNAFIAGIAGAILSAGAANALIIPIDPFDIPDGPLSDTTVNGVGRSTPDIVINDLGITRRLFINLLARSGRIQDSVEISDGELDINNGTGERTEVRLIYGNFDAINAELPEEITSLAFLFEVVESDANDLSVELRVDNMSLGLFEVPGGAMNEILRFEIPLDTVFGEDFRVIINGQAGYDATFALLGLEVGTPVPAPAMLGLFGLGLVALGARRRRR